MTHMRAIYLRHTSWRILDAKTQPNGKVEVMEAPVDGRLSADAKRNPWLCKGIDWMHGETIAVLPPTHESVIRDEFTDLVQMRATDTASIEIKYEEE